MKIRNIQRVIREKLNNYLASITDPILVDKMKKDILVTGGSIASMLLNEEVKDYDVYFRTRETTLAFAEYYCKIARDEKIADMWVLHKGMKFVQECLSLDVDNITKTVKDEIKEQDEDNLKSEEGIEAEDLLTIDSPLCKFMGLGDISCREFEGHQISIRTYIISTTHSRMILTELNHIRSARSE